MKINSYQTALDYLYSFVDYSRERSDRYSAEAFDLGRMADLLARLSQPHLRYPTLHVAGTKGKGSVAALMASCLAHAGYRTGLYTSPHLVDFTERIQINGSPIPPPDVASLTADLAAHAARVPGLTTFELVTALGFMHFARQRVEAAVIEVGLGGRLDATNLVQPSVTAITSISFDHTHLLGNTLGAIAGEKAGILKPGVPLVVAPQLGEARGAILARASEVGVPVTEIGVDWIVEPEAQDVSGQSFRLYRTGDGRSPVRLRMPLLGRHQLDNAAVAYAALALAGERGLPLSDRALREGFSEVNWPGRFQILRHDPSLVVDAAHNQDSASRLAETAASVYPDRPMSLVFGASEDKDLDGMLRALLPQASRVIFTQARHPRAASVESLVALAGTLDREAEAVIPAAQAVQTALAEAPENSVVLVTGSLFVVGEVLQAWQAGRLALGAAPLEVEQT